MHVSVQAVASNMVGTLRRPHEMGKGKDRLLGNKMLSDMQGSCEEAELAASYLFQCQQL